MEVVDAETNDKLSRTGETGATDDEQPIDDHDQVDNLFPRRFIKLKTFNLLTRKIVLIL